jgi:hypothetical protein
MPMKLTWMERQIFLNRNWGPGPLLDLLAPLAFKAVYAGHQLGIFDLLDQSGPLTAGEIGLKIKADEAGIGILVDTLAGLGYLRNKGRLHYVNSPMTRSWLLQSSSSSLAELFGYFNDAFERWSDLTASIRSGMSAAEAHRWFDRHPGSWDRYHAGMRSIARLMAGEIVLRAKLPRNAARLIDIGGSHGLYAVRFCQHYPGLSAMIFDWRQAKPTAEQTIAESHMEKRITYVEGDLLTNDLGNNFDVALLFNVIRVFKEPIAITILKKVHAALNSGGMVLIADQFYRSMPTPFSQVNSLLIALELFNMGLGKMRTASETMALLAKAGFTKPREIKIRRSPGTGIVSAVKE